MLDLYKEIATSQFEATFCTLNTCIERCPESAWNEPVVNLKFCQAAFHALFFADLYLGQDVDSFRQQPYHRDNVEFFGDYEELEDRPQVSLYSKAVILTYLQHCRNKAVQVVAAESVESLCARSGFSWLAFSRAELHIYNIRHIQHHAAQLSMRLRINTQEDIHWVKSGWSNNRHRNA